MSLLNLTKLENLPTEIKEKGRFCCWRYEERNGRKTKVPYQPDTGYGAKSNDPNSFTDYKSAVKAADYDGIGIGLFDGICAVDLDNCIHEDGTLSDTAVAIVKLLHSYTEYSPSGKGLHILFKADAGIYDTERYYIMNHKAGIEVYAAGATNKYVTVTGNRLNAYDYGDRTEELKILLEKYMVRPEAEIQREIPAGNAINAVNHDAEFRETNSNHLSSETVRAEALDEEELLRLAMNCRSGADFERLWHGDISGFSSQSEADMALYSRLAFWSGCDAAMMDHLFRRLGLMRPKWDGRRGGSTYGAKTIQKAIAGCSEVYTPAVKLSNEREDRSCSDAQSNGRSKESFPEQMLLSAQEENDMCDEVKKQNEGNQKPERKFGPITPLKSQSQNLPPFPIECLPQVLRDYVSAVAEHSQTSPDMAATISLGVLAACLQGKYQVEGTPGYSEPLSLYVVVTAAPGERKSSVLRDMTSCISEYETEYNEKLEPMIRENRRTKEVLERQIEALKKRLEKKQDRAAEMELQQLQDQLEELPDIKKLQLYADDCSCEALANLLSKNGGRMAVVSSEGGIFDILAGRYSSKPNLDVWLKGHCGDTIRTDRLGREAEYILHPALTAILSIQPSVLDEIMANSTMTGRGLIARFLYSSPPSRIGKRVFNAPPVLPETAAAYKSLIFKLMAIPVPDEAEKLCLSDVAREKIAEAFAEHEKFLTGEGQEISDWANKYIGAVLRIGGLLHLAEHDPETNKEISEVTISNALTIGKYLLAHARYAYAVMGTDITIQKARFVLAKIRKMKIREIKRSDLFQMCRGKFYKKTEEIFPTLELLEDHGYLRLEQPAHTSSGRPPDVMVIVNSEAVSA